MIGILSTFETLWKEKLAILFISILFIARDTDYCKVSVSNVASITRQQQY